MLPDSQLLAAELVTRRAQSGLLSGGPSAGREQGCWAGGLWAGPGPRARASPRRGSSDARLINVSVRGFIFSTFLCIFENFHEELK